MKISSVLGRGDDVGRDQRLAENNRRDSRMLLGRSTLKIHFCGKETLINQLCLFQYNILLVREHGGGGGCMVGKFARESLTLLQGHYVEPGKVEATTRYQISLAQSVFVSDRSASTSPLLRRRCLLVSPSSIIVYSNITLAFLSSSTRISRRVSSSSCVPFCYVDLKRLSSRRAVFQIR